MDQSEQNKPKRYFTEKVLSKSSAPPTLSSEVLRKSKDYGNNLAALTIKPGQHPISLGLDFRTKDGNQTGIFYHEIASPISFNPERGIELKTSALNIRIQGRNLKFIYELILEHRLVWIGEGEASLPAKGEEPSIDRIVLEQEDAP